jgi:signal transduction histidine kinase
MFISVTDTGYGIPKEQQAKIFGKLYRADNVRKLDVEGTGLGLYIVKEVVEMLGGKIWFESTESVGTTFYAVIPLKTLPSK